MQIMPTNTAVPPPAGVTARAQTAPRVVPTETVAAPANGAERASQTQRQAAFDLRNERQPSPSEQLEQALDEANRQPSVVAANLSFSIDQDSRRLVVKLIDNNTQDVIRQIPSEEFLRMSRAIQQMQGLLVRDVA